MQEEFRVFWRTNVYKKSKSIKDRVVKVVLGEIIGKQPPDSAL